MIVGLPASGKTTLARQLARDRGGIRLNADEWMRAVGVDLFDEPFRARLEGQMTQLAANMLQQSLCVVIEFGSWSKAERDELLTLARSAGADTELICLNPPIDTLWQRLSVRSIQPGETPIDRDTLQGYTDDWDPPTAEELRQWNAAQARPGRSTGDSYGPG